MMLDALGDGPVVIDGGLSTQLELMGYSIEDSLWTARVLIEHPAIITEAHRAFIEAGAQVVITASYQVSRAGFIEAGRSPGEADDALRASVGAARAAGDALVAASVGPFGAIAHDGSEYHGRYGRSIDELASFHAERIGILVDAGPDLLAVETIPDADEALAIAQVLAQFPHMPVWFSFTAADDARLWAGQSIEEAVAIVAGCESVVAIGVNCTAPEHVSSLVTRIRATTAHSIIVYPNAGGAWDADTKTWLSVPRDRMAAQVLEWRDAGASMIGGCCGTDAQGIAAIAQSLATR